MRVKSYNYTPGLVLGQRNVICIRVIFSEIFFQLKLLLDNHELNYHLNIQKLLSSRVYAIEFGKKYSDHFLILPNIFL
jgi:hypothetical protein